MTVPERSMFRDYDIRGKVSDAEMNEASVDLIARGYAALLHRRGIQNAVVGYDARETSALFQRVFRDALLASGIDVYDIGLAITPMMYWAQYHYQCQGGANITASHNPSDWSGVKLALDYSRTTVRDDIDEIYDIIANGSFVEGQGKLLADSPIDDDYVTDLVSRVQIARPVKVLINAGNGTAGPISVKAFERAGCEVVPLHCEIDRGYPHYFPNPSLVEMMEDTGANVRAAAAQIGLAIDGDGDRLGSTDEAGSVVWPDRYLILLARQILKSGGARKRIVFDVKCSAALAEEIVAHGGEPIMWKTGHSWIKNKCQEVDAALGGEMSGHIFVRDNYYGFDDAVFTGLKLVEYLASQPKSYSALLADTPHYCSSPTLQVDAKDKHAIVKQLTAHFRKDYEVIDIDGARVIFEDGWGLARASSNMEVIVLRFEARTEAALSRIEGQFRSALAPFEQSGQVAAEWVSG